MQTAILVVALAFSLFIVPAFADNYSYSPLRYNQTPIGPFPSPNEIREDMQNMSEFGVTKIRIYETGQSLERIVSEARNQQITVSVGIELTGNEEEDRKKISDITSRIKQFDNIDFLILGNNPLFNKQVTPEKLIEYIQFAKSLTGIPVTSINGYEFWTNDYYDPVADAVDFIMVDLFTDNSKTPQEQIQIIEGKYNQIQREHKKEIVIESGWSTVNSSKHAQDTFRALLKDTGIKAYFFEWADESWKLDPIEAGYGVYEADRTEKITLEIPSPLPQERIQEKINPFLYVSIGAAIGGIAAWKYLSRHNTDGWGDPVID